MEQIAPLIREQLATGQAVRFSPRGVSMLPLLRQAKDKVELSPLPQTLKPYDILFYQRPNGTYVLHRLIRVKKTMTCIGDHQFVYEYGVERDWCIGVVSAIYRGNKRYSVTHKGYLLYCRIWQATRPFRHLCHRVLNRIKRPFQKNV